MMKETKKKIERLERRIRSLDSAKEYWHKRFCDESDEVVVLKNDLVRFRYHFIKRFRWWVKLLSESSLPCLKWTIKADTQFLQTVKKFDWPAE